MLIQTGGKISSVYNGGVILIKCTPPTLPVHTCTGDKYYSVQPCPNHVKYQHVAGIQQFNKASQHIMNTRISDLKELITFIEITLPYN